jgi:uncharacterized protein
MTHVIADTGNWIPSLSPPDKLHSHAQEVSEQLGATPTVISDWVLTELLNSIAEQGPHLRMAAVDAAAVLRASGSVTVAPQTRESFEGALKLYRERPDKGSSLTDCSSFLLMRQFGIDKAPTFDKHFEQAGFAALLR